MKTINLLWSISLIVLGIGSVFLACANLWSLELPDFVIRGIGLLDLAALPVLGYTTVKKQRNKQQQIPGCGGTEEKQTD